MRCPSPALRLTRCNFVRVFLWNLKRFEPLVIFDVRPQLPRTRQLRLLAHNKWSRYRSLRDLYANWGVHRYTIYKYIYNIPIPHTYWSITLEWFHIVVMFIMFSIEMQCSGVIWLTCPISRNWIHECSWGAEWNDDVKHVVCVCIYIYICGNKITISHFEHLPHGCLQIS